MVRRRFALSLSFMTSAPPIVVLAGTPFRRQVLTHVERARHRLARGTAREPEAQRIAVPLGIRTGDLHGVSLDRSGQIARDEIALMRPFNAIAGLFQMESMGG